MKIRILALATIASLAMASAALAGSTTLKNGDQKMKLFCDNSGCYTQEVMGPFKFGKRNRIGPGGSSNYNKHKASYNAKGWN